VKRKGKYKGNAGERKGDCGGCKRAKSKGGSEEWRWEGGAKVR